MHLFIASVCRRPDFVRTGLTLSVMSTYITLTVTQLQYTVLTAKNVNNVLCFHLLSELQIRLLTYLAFSNFLGPMGGPGGPDPPPLFLAHDVGFLTLPLAQSWTPSSAPGPGLFFSACEHA